MNVQIKLLRDNAKLPTRGSDSAVGYDLYAAPVDNQPIVIKAHGFASIPLGISTSFDDGIGAFIFARSGIACKNGIRPANCVGVIDPDYRGEWQACLRNDSDVDFTVESGMRVAQVVFKQVELPAFERVSELSSSLRGEGGFGSTGK